MPKIHRLPLFTEVYRWIFFMRTSVITYNRKMAEFFLLFKQFDALCLFYTLKIIYAKSIIYKLEGFDLYDRLKAEKILPYNFSRERFKEALIFLAKHGYIFKSGKYVGLKSIKSNIGYYKSKIKYNRKNINFNIIQKLLVKEELLYSKKKQEQAIAFREKMATVQNKALGKVKKSELDTFNRLGECRLNQVSFTYRNIAKKLSKSLAWVKNSIDWIKSNTDLKIYKITECNHYVGKNVDFSVVKNRLYPNCYAYLTPSGNVVAILGSSITTIK